MSAGASFTDYAKYLTKVLQHSTTLPSLEYLSLEVVCVDGPTRVLEDLKKAAGARDPVVTLLVHETKKA